MGNNGEDRVVVNKSRTKEHAVIASTFPYSKLLVNNEVIFLKKFRQVLKKF